MRVVVPDYKSGDVEPPCFVIQNVRLIVPGRTLLGAPPAVSSSKKQADDTSHNPSHCRKISPDPPACLACKVFWDDSPGLLAIPPPTQRRLAATLPESRYATARGQRNDAHYCFLHLIKKAPRIGEGQRKKFLLHLDHIHFPKRSFQQVSIDQACQAYRLSNRAPPNKRLQRSSEDQGDLPTWRCAAVGSTAQPPRHETARVARKSICLGVLGRKMEDLARWMES